MARPLLRILAPFLALLTLAGCGGGGGSNEFNATTSIRITGGETFNGNTSPIIQNTATATVAEGRTVADLSLEDGRTLRISVPTDTPSAGQSFPVARENGAMVTYTNDDLDMEVWGGMTGKVTIVAASPTRLAFRLDKVSVDAVTGWQGEGTAVLDGVLADVVRFGPGGTFAFELSTEGGTSADLSGFPATSTVAYTTGSGSSVLTLRDPDPELKRGLSVSVPDSVPVGTAIDATEAMVYWNEGEFSLVTTGELFRAVSGTVRVLRRSRDAYEVELTNVRFEPYNLPKQNLATGAFVVSGTLAKP